MADSDEKNNFTSKLMTSVPSWAWGGLGLFFGVAMTLQITGYNGAMIRVVEAQVKKIEKSADDMDQTALRVEQLLKGSEQKDKILVNHEMRIERLEAKVK